MSPEHEGALPTRESEITCALRSLTRRGAMPTQTAALSLSDVLGLGRLAAEAAEGITGLVEEMHTSILDTPVSGPSGRS
jgi:hypothetical protein